MKPSRFAALAVMALLSVNAYAQRQEIMLEEGWKFHLGEAEGASASVYDDAAWQVVSVPHDWAIYGPFDRNNDLQNVAVTQNFETKASWKTGRSGGLPYMGTGWYRRSFDVPAGKRAILMFDGAMSEARVYVNGQEICFQPYGY
ncbi:MAG: sugar-binding domain-containing protein, partial [Candidatus Cryptobacteroides sp.]